MAGPNPLTSWRLPEAVRRRLEVATAMAWEALVETHTRHALQFISLLSDRLAFDEAVDRYLRETDVAESMGVAVRTRVLVALEDAERGGTSRPQLEMFREDESEPAGEAEVAGWRRFRPDVLMRGVMERQRRNEETEGWIQLAIARAEEGVIGAHVDNAITFVALLDQQLPLDKAVGVYIESVALTGGRAQAVAQRTMARLAEVHLPVGYQPLSPDGVVPKAEELPPE